MKKLLLLLILASVSQSMFGMDTLKSNGLDALRSIGVRWGWVHPSREDDECEAGPSDSVGDVTFPSVSAPSRMYEMSRGSEDAGGIEFQEVDMDALTLERFKNMSEEEQGAMEESIDRMLGNSKVAQQTVARKLAPPVPARGLGHKVKTGLSDSDFRAGLQEMQLAGASVQETMLLKMHFNQMRAEEGQRRAAVASNLFARKTFCIHGVMFLITSGSVGLSLVTFALRETGYTATELLIAAAANAPIG